MKVFLLVLLTVLMSSCIQGYKQDALVEEIGEEVLKSTTGISVDFTPQSKE